jgi:hypothetical protein
MRDYSNPFMLADNEKHPFLVYEESALFKLISPPPHWGALLKRLVEHSYACWHVIATTALPHPVPPETALRLCTDTFNPLQLEQSMQTESQTHEIDLTGNDHANTVLKKLAQIQALDLFSIVTWNAPLCSITYNTVPITTWIFERKAMTLV